MGIPRSDAHTYQMASALATPAPTAAHRPRIGDVILASRVEPSPAAAADPPAAVRTRGPVVAEIPERGAGTPTVDGDRGCSRRSSREWLENRARSGSSPG